jgi:rhodanese-related sulfurtransferase
VDNISHFASRHWQLVVAFVVIFIVLMIYEYYSLKKAGKAISTAQAIEQINHFSAVVIDLRPAEIFKKGHIIGAIRATEADFRLPKMHQHKDKPVILVCTRGFESQKLAPKLASQGFSQLMTLEGGISAWQTAKLPLVKK